MIYTAGIFVFRNYGKEFLIVHPTNFPKNVWSIPKGECDDNFKENAIRELKEETNIVIPTISNSSIFYMGNYAYNNFRKCLVAFGVNLSLDELRSQKLECSSMVQSTNIFSMAFPEVDEFKWVVIEDALNLIHPTQQQALIHWKNGEI